MPQLGGPFLSQVYLVVDYENNQFSLAKTKRHGTQSKLITVGCDNYEPESRNTGAIIGGIVGGIGGLALIGGAIIFCLFRKSQNTGEKVLLRYVVPKKQDLETGGPIYREIALPGHEGNVLPAFSNIPVPVRREIPTLAHRETPIPDSPGIVRTTSAPLSEVEGSELRSEMEG